MIFAVDFDGTIVEHRFPDIGEEKPAALHTLRQLQRAGHKVIIWTCRCATFLDDAKKWFYAQGFQPDAYNENVDTMWGIAGPKVYADVYIDDRSFPPFTDWGQVWTEYLNSDGSGKKEYLK